MSRIASCAAVVALLTVPVAAQQTPTFRFPSIHPESHGVGASSIPSDVDWAFGSGPTVDFYGFIRLYMQYNDSRMNNPSIPFIALSEDLSPPVGVPTGRVASADDAEFTLSPRLTRVGVRFASDEAVKGLGDPALTGKLETDFYNIGLGDSDSRQALRVRLAYLDLDWGNWSLRAGQDWDVISPLNPVVNNDLVMWGAGNTGFGEQKFESHSVGVTSSTWKRTLTFTEQ